MYQNTTEDKTFISSNKIINKVNAIYENENKASLKRTIQTQLTKMANLGYLSKQRLSYSLAIKVKM